MTVADLTYWLASFPDDYEVKILDWDGYNYYIPKDVTLDPEKKNTVFITL